MTQGHFFFFVTNTYLKELLDKMALKKDYIHKARNIKEMLNCKKFLIYVLIIKHKT